MTLLALLVSIWAPAVSAQSDAIRVDALLKDLAAQSESRLECAADVGREAVVVQFKDEPLDEVLDRLAKVLGAEWSELGGAKRLIRSPELLKKEAAAEQSRLAGQWKLLFHGILAEIEKMPPVDDNFADILVGAGPPSDKRNPEADSRTAVRLLQTNPAARTAAKLLAAWGPEPLIDMRVGERVVFSDSPTAMQKAIPRSWSAAWGDQRHAMELMFAAKKRAADRTKRLGFLGMPELGPGSLDSGYGKTIFAVKRFGLLDVIWQLITVDREGQRLLFASGRIPDAGRRLMPATLGGGAALDFSEQQKAFAFMYVNMGYAAAGGMPELKLPDGTVVRPSFGVSMAESQERPPDLGLAELVKDPVARDPVGPLAGNLLRQMAARANRPLIASVSDGGITALMRSLNGAATLTDKAVMSVLTQEGVDPAARVPHIEVMADPKWTLIRPYFPAYARQTQFDRGALKSLFEAIRLKGSLALSDCAAYLKSSPLPRFGSLDTLYMIHANPQIPREDFPAAFTGALPFLSQLTPAQSERLAVRGVTYRELSPAQRETIRRWVFDTYEYDPTEHMPEAPQPGPLVADPTERYSTGVPLDAIVRIRHSARPAVQVRMESGYRFSWDAGAFVWNEQKGTQGDFLGARFSRVVKGYRPARQIDAIVEVQLEADRSIRHTACETTLLPGNRESGKDSLLPEFLAQVEAVRKAIAPPVRPPGAAITPRRT